MLGLVDVKMWRVVTGVGGLGTVGLGSGGGGISRCLLIDLWPKCDYFILSLLHCSFN